MNKPLIVGLDVHRKSHRLCMMNHEGQALTSKTTVPNNQPGTEAFVQQLATQLETDDFDGVRIAAEATGWYWWHFFQTLDQHPFLQAWPVELYPLNPRLTANFKRTYSDLGHTDTTDAFVVADRLRMGRDLPPPYHLSLLALSDPVSLSSDPHVGSRKVRLPGPFVLESQ